MAYEQLDPVRNILIACTMVSAVSFSPELCDPIVRPAIRSWARLKHFLLVTKERFQRKCQNSFWEIDMTKFEP